MRLPVIVNQRARRTLQFTGNSTGPNVPRSQMPPDSPAGWVPDQGSVLKVTPTGQRTSRCCVGFGSPSVCWNRTRVCAEKIPAVGTAMRRGQNDSANNSHAISRSVVMAVVTGSSTHRDFAWRRSTRSGTYERGDRHQRDVWENEKYRRRSGNSNRRGCLTTQGTASRAACDATATPAGVTTDGQPFRGSRISSKIAFRRRRCWPKNLARQIDHLRRPDGVTTFTSETTIEAIAARVAHCATGSDH